MDYFSLLNIIVHSLLIYSSFHILDINSTKFISYIFGHLLLILLFILKIITKYNNRFKIFILTISRFFLTIFAILIIKDELNINKLNTFINTLFFIAQFLYFLIGIEMIKNKKINYVINNTVTMIYLFFIIFLTGKTFFYYELYNFFSKNLFIISIIMINIICIYIFFKYFLTLKQNKIIYLI